MRNKVRGSHGVGAVLIAALVTFAACSSSSSPKSTGTTASTSKPTKVPTEIDRSGRFAGVDSFCEKAKTSDTAKPKAIDDGITATAVKISHIRVELEQLKGLGFAIDIGDANDQAATFARIINERCGGIHGRKLDISNIEVPALASQGQDTSSLAQAACIKAAEDQHAAFAFSTSGFGDVGVPCLTRTHKVVFRTSYTVTLEDMANAEGRLYSSGFAGEESLTYLARDLARSGKLKGKTIGVVRPDGTPDAQIVQRGLVDVLRNELHLNVKRVDTIGCGGTNICDQGIAPSVQGMIADGVDVLFPLLNVISLPKYLVEMVNQGVKPGEIAMYQSDYLAQSGDLVSGKVVEFGGDAAGKLYNGTTIIAGGATGAFRLPGFKPGAFSEMCNREYQENGNPDGPFSATDEATNTKYGALIGVCATIRVIARALDDAGPNPTRADLASAMQGLGAIDQGADSNFGSYGTGKFSAPNYLWTNVFHYPCPYKTTFKSKACIVVEGDARPAPRDPIKN